MTIVNRVKCTQCGRKNAPRAFVSRRGLTVKSCSLCREKDAVYKAKRLALEYESAKHEPPQASTIAPSRRVTIRQYPRIYSESMSRNVGEVYDKIHEAAVAKGWTIGVDKRVNWCALHNERVRDCNCDPCLAEAAVLQVEISLQIRRRQIAALNPKHTPGPRSQGPAGKVTKPAKTAAFRFSTEPKELTIAFSH